MRRLNYVTSIFTCVEHQDDHFDAHEPGRFDLLLQRRVTIGGLVRREQSITPKVATILQWVQHPQVVLFLAIKVSAPRAGHYDFCDLAPILLLDFSGLEPHAPTFHELVFRRRGRRQAVVT